MSKGATTTTEAIPRTALPRLAVKNHCQIQSQTGLTPVIAWKLQENQLIGYNCRFSY